MMAYHIIVKGRVQGVGYRWFAEREAARHCLSGYVRNLPDGRVEVLAQGEPEMLDRYCGELRRGPSSARVVDLVSRTVDVEPGLVGFQVRF